MCIRDRSRLSRCCRASIIATRSSASCGVDVRRCRGTANAAVGERPPNTREDAVGLDDDSESRLAVAAGRRAPIRMPALRALLSSSDGEWRCRYDDGCVAHRGMRCGRAAPSVGDSARMYASEGGVRACDDGELDMRAELVNSERKAPGSQPGTLSLIHI